MDEYSGGSSNPLRESQKTLGMESSDKYPTLFEPTLVVQVIVYLCIGFILTSICALTDVPWYIMWIILFAVWAYLFVDFLRRWYAYKVLVGAIHEVTQSGHMYVPYKHVLSTPTKKSLTHTQQLVLIVTISVADLRYIGKLAAEQ
jgi:hypothetical protein